MQWFCSKQCLVTFESLIFLEIYFVHNFFTANSFKNAFVSNHGKFLFVDSVLQFLCRSKHFNSKPGSNPQIGGQSMDPLFFDRVGNIFREKSKRAIVRDPFFLNVARIFKSIPFHFWRIPWFVGLTFVESSSVDISSGENSFFVRYMDACSGEIFLGQIHLHFDRTGYDNSRFWRKKCFFLWNQGCSMLFLNFAEKSSFLSVFLFKFCHFAAAVFQIKSLKVILLFRGSRFTFWSILSFCLLWVTIWRRTTNLKSKYTFWFQL